MMNKKIMIREFIKELRENKELRDEINEVLSL